MLPRLLWRCPLCAVNEALIHRQRLLRPDSVTCAACNARWQLRRVVGDGFYLKLTRASDADPTGQVGVEADIAEWYDRMKATIVLTPQPDHAGLLDDGEILYLRSCRVEMQAEADDPLIFPDAEIADEPQSIAETVSAYAGAGTLMLTGRRLIWLNGRSTRVGNRTLVSFPLRHILSAHAIFGISLHVRERLYMLYFPEESMLKWVTYLSLVSEHMRDETWPRLKTTHW